MTRLSSPAPVLAAALLGIEILALLLAILTELRVANSRAESSSSVSVS